MSSPKKKKKKIVPIKKGVGTVTILKKKSKKDNSDKPKYKPNPKKSVVVKKNTATKKSPSEKKKEPAKKTVIKKVKAKIPIKRGYGTVTKPKKGKGKQRSLARVRKFRHKGKVVAYNVHVAASVLCQIMRLNKMKCSYQYIIDKIFFFIDYYMEHGGKPEKLEPKDKLIYESLKFIEEFYPRQEGIYTAHKYYDTNVAKRFYIRPIIIKKEYSDTLMALRKKLSTYFSKNVYIGLVLYNIFALATTYYKEGSISGRLSQLQEELATYLDFYDDHFTLTFGKSILRFDFEFTDSDLDINQFVDNLYTGEVKKLAFMDFMAVLEYHLSIMWKARDMYLDNADDDTMVFLVYTMLETLTKTFYADFHNLDMEGGDRDVGLAFIMGEFLHESHISSVYLGEVLRNKTGLPEVEDED